MAIKNVRLHKRPIREARCLRLQAEVGAWKSKRAAEAARADAADAANARLLAELDSARVQLEVRTVPARRDVIARTVAPNMRKFALYALGVSASNRPLTAESRPLRGRSEQKSSVLELSPLPLKVCPSRTGGVSVKPRRQCGAMVLSQQAHASVNW